MEVVLRLLSELRLVLVAIAGICCAAFLFAGLSSLRDLRRAVFRLERSAIVGRAISSWLKAGFCIIAGVAIWMVTGVAPVAPSTLSSNPLNVTPTITFGTTEPTPLPTADLSNAALQMTAVPTEVIDVAAIVTTVDPNIAVITPSATTVTIATISVTPATTTAGLPTPIVELTRTPEVSALSPTSPPATDTPASAAPVVAEALVADCPNPAARIDSPSAGETISGSSIVRGTADFPGGSGRYKVEILRPNIQGWAFLWENHNAVNDGVLMPKLDSTLFPPGVYTLRLSLVDGAGQETGIYCSVQIRIA